MEEAKETITFESLHGLYGSLRLAKDYVTKERLERLFQCPTELILLDKEAEEVLPQPRPAEPDGQRWFPDLDASRQPYIVVDREAFESFDSTEGEEAPQARMITPQEMVQRLKRLEAMQVARKELIQELYRPKHPHLYRLSDDMLMPSFLQAFATVAALQDSAESERKEALLSILRQETATTRLYSLVVFTPEFCQQLIEEVDHFERSGLPVMRPNSMNNYGLILDEIGFRPFFSELREKYVVPLASMLYPDCGGDSLDDHHSFIVQYEMDKDRDLDFHYDDSEVTLNLCLGKDFQGGSLYFKGLLEDEETHSEGFEYEQIPGRALLHMGRHRHGAKPIIAGERYNLIVWFRSSSYRKRIQEEYLQQHHHHDHDGCSCSCPAEESGTEEPQK
ncbi:2-oxoglutarate and iron-dependent oxygenase domain-containing protein 2 [Balamuthia mandrillaris]